MKETGEDFDGSQMPAMMEKSMKASNVPLTTEFKELFANFYVSANDFVVLVMVPGEKKNPDSFSDSFLIVSYI